MTTAGGSKPIDEASAEKKFSSVKGTQESIQMLAMWVLHQKTHHEKVVELWLQVLKKCKLAQRLTLFYVCNEVVQTCKRKHAIVYKDAFKEILPEATILVRDSSVKSNIERIYRIWEERSVYDGAFVEELISVLNDSKVRPTFAMKMLAEFKPGRLLEVIGGFADLEKENESKRRRLSAVNIDIANKNYTKIMKDRSHGRQYTLQVEEAHKVLDQYVGSLLAEGRDRETLLELLDQSELFYEAQYGEARIVANAYKNFGTRVHNLRKKLTDVRRTLPDPLSPVPSPSMDAPSPAASPPPGDTTDNMEMVDMDLSDNEDSRDQLQHLENQKQLQLLLQQREQLQQQLAKYNVKSSEQAASLTNHDTEKDNVGDVSDEVVMEEGEDKGGGLEAEGYSPTRVSEGSGSPPGPAFSPLSSPHGEQSEHLDDDTYLHSPGYDSSEQQEVGVEHSPAPTLSQPSPTTTNLSQGGDTIFSQRISSLFSVLNRASAPSQPSPPHSLDSPGEVGGVVLSPTKEKATAQAGAPDSFNSLEVLSTKLGIRLQCSSAASTGSSLPSGVVSLLDRLKTDRTVATVTAAGGSDAEDETDLEKGARGLEEVAEESKSSGASYLSNLLASFGGRPGPTLPGLAEGVVDEDEDEADDGSATPVMDENPGDVLPPGDLVNPLSGSVTTGVAQVDPLDLLNRLLKRGTSGSAVAGCDASSNGVVAPPLEVFNNLSTASYTGTLGGSAAPSAGILNHVSVGSYPGPLGGSIVTSMEPFRPREGGYIASSSYTAPTPMAPSVTLDRNGVGSSVRSQPLSLVQYEGNEDCVSPPREAPGGGRPGWGYSSIGGGMRPPFIPSNVSPGELQRQQQHFQPILGSPSHGLTSSLPQRPVPFPSPHPPGALLSPPAAFPGPPNSLSGPQLAPSGEAYPAFETNMSMMQKDSGRSHQHSSGGATTSLAAYSQGGATSMGVGRFGSSSPPSTLGSYEYEPPTYNHEFGTPGGFSSMQSVPQGLTPYGSMAPGVRTFLPPRVPSPPCLRQPLPPPPPPLPQEPFLRGGEGFGRPRFEGQEPPPLPPQPPPSMPPLPRGPIRLPAPPHLPPEFPPWRERFSPPGGGMERRFFGNSNLPPDHPLAVSGHQSNERETDRHDSIGYDLLRQATNQAAARRVGPQFDLDHPMNNGRGQKREFESEDSIGYAEKCRELRTSVDMDECNAGDYKNNDVRNQFCNNGERNVESYKEQEEDLGRKMDNDEYIDDRDNGDLNHKNPSFQGELNMHGPRGGPNMHGPRGGPNMHAPRGGPNLPGPRGGPNLPGPRGGPNSFGPRGCRNEFGPRAGPKELGPLGGPNIRGPHRGPIEFISRGGPNVHNLRGTLNDQDPSRNIGRDERFSSPLNPPTSMPQFRGAPAPRMRLPPPPKSGGTPESIRPVRPAPHKDWADGPGRGMVRGPRPLRPRGPGPSDLRPPEIRPLIRMGRGAGPPSLMRGGGMQGRGLSRGGPRMFARPRF